jgi:opacity protein-like surface antigen
MRASFSAGLTSVALAASLLAATPVVAADLGGYKGGSIKDGYMPAPTYSAGPCYVRSDVGYSWSRAPNAEFVGNAVDPVVYNATLDDGVFFEGGLGCGMGSRGLRGELTFGMREKRNFDGDVDIFVPAVGAIDPPIHTSLRTYTMMANGYYDLGKFGGFVPYVGAGIGFAYHKMGDVTIDDPATPNRIFGDDKLSFAWGLMAGVGYQVSDRAILDIGYRYIDLGAARATNADSAQAWNPRLEINDLRAHEVKVGLRYHFGGGTSEAVYAPVK